MITDVGRLCAGQHFEQGCVKISFERSEAKAASEGRGVLIYISLYNIPGLGFTYNGECDTYLPLDIVTIILIIIIMY